MQRYVFHPSIPLIGRSRSLDQLARAWRDGARCLTVVGPPGVGKTRLALEAYARADELFALKPTSTCVCLLAGCTSPDEVAARLGDALAVPAEVLGSDPARGIGNWLRNGPGGLVVLDNAEQVVAPVAELVHALRRTAPQVGFLVTSRIRLGLTGETVFPLEPLPVPASEARAPEAVMANEATQLFTLFAGIDRPVGAAEAPLLARIVRRLEGLPLSLDLAARRLDTLSLGELDERLGDKFAVLRDGFSSGPRSAKDALWLTLEYSWQLLEPWQRDALAQLAVFRGDVPLSLAEEVVEVPATEAPFAPTVLDALQVLVRHSLVERVEDSQGATSFRLLETIREFVERRARDVDREGLWSRYTLAVAARGEELAAASRRHRGELSMAELNALRLDLRAVVDGLPGWPDVDPRVAGRAAFALAMLLEYRGDHEQQLERVRAALDRLEVPEPASADPETARLRGRLVREVARACQVLSRVDEGIEAARAALAIAEELDDPWLRAHTLVNLGHLYYFAADERSGPTLRQALACCEPLDDAGVALAGAYCNLANVVTDQGDTEAARTYILEGLRACDQVGWEMMKSTLLCQLGVLELNTGGLDEAARSFRQAGEIAERMGDFVSKTMTEALLATTSVFLDEDDDDGLALAVERFQQLADRRSEAYARFWRALQRLGRARFAQARSDLETARELLTEIDDTWYIGPCQTVLAAMTAVAGDYGAARELVASADIADVDRILQKLPPLFEVVVQACDPDPSLPLTELRNRLGRLAADVPNAGAVRAAETLLEAAANQRLAWTIASNGQWFDDPSGGHVDLGRRRAPRRILAALARARVERPGAGLTRQDLFEVGWPGQRIDEQAAASRVYVAVSTLRSLGLGELLVHSDDGYTLDPTQPVSIEPTA